MNLLPGAVLACTPYLLAYQVLRPYGLASIEPLFCVMHILRVIFVVLCLVRHYIYLAM